MFDEPKFMAALDRLINQLQAKYPAIEVNRIQDYPGMPGDDYIWFFKHPDCGFEAQVDPGIETLFLMSTDEAPGYVETDSIDEAMQTILRWLHIK